MFILRSLESHKSNILLSSSNKESLEKIKSEIIQIDAIYNITNDKIQDLKAEYQSKKDFEKIDDDELYDELDKLYKSLFDNSYENEDDLLKSFEEVFNKQKEIYIFNKEIDVKKNLSDVKHKFEINKLKNTITIPEELQNSLKYYKAYQDAEHNSGFFYDEIQLEIVEITEIS